MHDRLYTLGFTEAAGNFQDYNFGRGGLDCDRILAYAQYGLNLGWVNNAGFWPAPDGASGIIGMFIFAWPSPQRDGDLDAEVILHEYTHGLSDRLVGITYAQFDRQDHGLGGGWSDFYALSSLSKSSDNVSGNYPMGGYVTYQLNGLTENYYYGIRRYPYSIALNKNPLTFKEIDPNQADQHTGIPVNPIIAGIANEVHNMGEVWCVTLWEARAKLVGRYGFAGNQIMQQLVTDGMILCPPNPNFIQARDAFFQAVLVSGYCSSDWGRLWEAFSKRGMGGGASAPDVSTSSGVVESFAGGPASPCDE